MGYANENSSSSTEWTATSARREQIARLQRAVDAIAGQPLNDDETSLDALIDFFVCRCRNSRQLSVLGAGLFTALRRESSYSVTAGVFDEQFAFRREGDVVWVTVDQQQLSEIRLDIAIRLATLLHGARHSATDQECAA